jgi:metal-dependent amidase/aminoacylase/carboxypeptidase family protein
VPSAPGRASSDFGDVSQQRPAAHAYFGITDEPTPVHSPEFCAAAGTDRAMERMLKAAEALGVAGYRYVADSDVRERVEADYEAAISARESAGEVAELWT